MPSDAELGKKTEVIMQCVASAVEDVLKEACGHAVGFALIIFEFGEPDVGNYISNAERSSMVKAFREVVKRLEKNQDIPASIGSVQ